MATQKWAEDTEEVKKKKKSLWALQPLEQRVINIRNNKKHI